MKGFSHQIVQDFILCLECSMHKHCEQIYLQIIHSVQHYNSHPNRIKSPEIVVAGAGHGNQTELAEGQKKQIIRDPNAYVSDEQNTHN